MTFPPLQFLLEITVLQSPDLPLLLMKKEENSASVSFIQDFLVNLKTYKSSTVYTSLHANFTESVGFIELRVPNHIL